VGWISLWRNCQAVDGIIGSRASRFAALARKPSACAPLRASPQPPRGRAPAQSRKTLQERGIGRSRHSVLVKAAGLSPDRLSRPAGFELAQGLMARPAPAAPARAAVAEQHRAQADCQASGARDCRTPPHAGSVSRAPLDLLVNSFGGSSRLRRSLNWGRSLSLIVMRPRLWAHHRRTRGDLGSLAPSVSGDLSRWRMMRGVHALSVAMCGPAPGAVSGLPPPWATICMYREGCRRGSSSTARNRASPTSAGRSRRLRWHSSFVTGDHRSSQVPTGCHGQLRQNQVARVGSHLRFERRRWRRLRNRFHMAQVESCGAAHNVYASPARWNRGDVDGRGEISETNHTIITSGS